MKMNIIINPYLINISYLQWSTMFLFEAFAVCPVSNVFSRFLLHQTPSGTRAARTYRGSGRAGDQAPFPVVAGSAEVGKTANCSCRGLLR